MTNAGSEKMASMEIPAIVMAATTTEVLKTTIASSAMELGTGLMNVPKRSHL